MSHKRRNVLKTLGAVGAGTVFAAGGAAAQEGNDCVEVVDEKTITSVPGPFVGVQSPATYGAAGVAFTDFSETESFYPAPAVFARAKHDGRRAHIVVTWNDGGADQTYMDVVLEHNQGGEWVEVAEGTGERTIPNMQPEGENSIEMTVEDGEFRDETEERAVIDDDEEYRFAIYTYHGITDFEINVEFEAFNTNCPSFKL